MGIRLYIVFRITKRRVSEAPAIQDLAILNYGIIEPEACVMFMMVFTAAAVKPTAVMSIMLQILLERALLEGLTTMLLPRTCVRGKDIIS